jgi:hypothetical protein
VRRLFAPAVDAYRAAEGRLTIRSEPASDIAAWLLDSLCEGVSWKGQA